MEKPTVACLRNQLMTLLRDLGDFEDPSAYELLLALMRKNWPQCF